MGQQAQENCYRHSCPKTGEKGAIWESLFHSNSEIRRDTFKKLLGLSPPRLGMSLLAFWLCLLVLISTLNRPSFPVRGGLCLQTSSVPVFLSVAV